MSKKISSHTYGILLVIVASSLWAIDGLIRANLTSTIPSATIVLIEHIVGSIILLPIFIKSLDAYKKLSPKDYLIIIGLSLVSGVLGTILFTQALSVGREVFDFSTPLLLQKLQPVVVVILSWIFLKEKISSKFILWGILALIGGYLVSFGFALVPLEFSNQLLLVGLSIGAAVAWASGTILSKKILEKLEYKAATAIRFVVAIPIAIIFMIVLKENYSLLSLEPGQIIRFLLIGLSTGAASIILYYNGLKRISPNVATFAELAYPIVSLMISITSLNPYGEPQVLTFGNIVGVVLLTVSILMISKVRGKKVGKYRGVVVTA